MGLGFAFDRMYGIHNAYQRKHAVYGVLILNGQIRFTIEPTADLGIASTSGRSRHIKPSNRAKSIACALKRRKEARSVKEREARAPVGIKVRLGPSLSEMKPTTEGSDQCQGNRKSCSEWASSDFSDAHLTDPFQDNTDNRGGGCTYQWFLDCTFTWEIALGCPEDTSCGYEVPHM